MRHLFHVPSQLRYLIGFALAGLTVLFAKSVGFDRDRAFYPVVLIVIALFYVLFAVMGGSMRAIIIESLVTTIFAVIAVVGFKSSPWIVAAALAGHGVFDSVHGSLIANAGVPPWWPGFCLAFDITIAVGMAWSISQRKKSSVDSPLLH